MTLSVSGTAVVPAQRSVGKVKGSLWNPTHCRVLCFWGFSQLTLHNTASDQIGKTLFHYRRKLDVVTYQPRFTGNQQHFSTWTLCNSCFLQKSAVSSHHYNCFVLHQARRNFRRNAEFCRSQVFQSAERLQREEERDGNSKFDTAN